MPLLQKSDDDITAAGDMVGTFRWGPGKLLPLPDKKRGRLSDAVATPLQGWMKYLTHRAGKDFIGIAQADRSIIDGLSYVCSLLLAFRKLGFEAHLKAMTKKYAKVLAAAGAEAVAIAAESQVSATATAAAQPDKPLVTLVLLGASHHCEQRLLVDSTYWDELGLEYPGCDWKLWFVGPEIDVDKVRLAPGVAGGDEDSKAVSLAVGQCGWGRSSLIAVQTVSW